MSSTLSSFLLLNVKIRYNQDTLSYTSLFSLNKRSWKSLHISTTDQLYGYNNLLKKIKITYKCIHNVIS